MYKMAHSISVILHSLSTWWHPNIEEESFALKFGNLPVNSRGMVMGFGQLCILNYSHQNLVKMWNCDIKVSKYKIIYVPCCQSCPTLWDLIDCSPPGSSVHGDSPGKNTGVGCHALLQGIFPIQGSNPGLLHYRQILYHLSYQGSPRILEWIA